MQTRNGRIPGGFARCMLEQATSLISGQQIPSIVLILIDNIDRLLTFCVSNPVQHDPRFDTKDVSWLGKRIIAVELDVIKMEELGG